MVGIDHGEEIFERDVDGSPRIVFIGSEEDGGRLGDRSEVVGRLGSLLRLPLQAFAVGQDCGGDGRSVVPSPSDQHHTETGHRPLSPERIVGPTGRHEDLAARVRPTYVRRLVDVLGLDVVVCVTHVRTAAFDRGRCWAIHFNRCVISNRIPTMLV